MTPVVVTPGERPEWPGIGPAGRVVARFLAEVRVTGDTGAAQRVMAPLVPAHQLVADDPHTVVRTPADYAEHVRDLLAHHGPVRFEVTGALEQDDQVHVRFRQLGAVLELGSVDYRVEAGRIAEYWIQVDDATASPTASAVAPPDVTHVRACTTPPPHDTKEKDMTSTSDTTSGTALTEAGLPAGSTWDIDPGHAEIAFIGRHFMMTKVRGRFTRVAGAVRVGESMDDSSVEVTIEMDSVESGNPTRDEHIRSAELFDVATYPTATFRSAAVEWSGDRGVVHGDLTIHGVTRRVALDIALEGQVRDPWGGQRAVFSGRTKVNREDFGVTWNVALEAGGVLVSKEIQIELDLETVLRAG